MRLLVRCIVENSGPRKVWVPLLALSVALPLVLVDMPLLQRQLIDDVFTAHRSDLLIPILTNYGALWVASLLGGIARQVLQTYLGERITQDLRQRLVSHATKLSVAYWNREHSGRMLALFYNDAGRVAGLFNSTVIGGVAGVVGTLVSAAIMFRLNPQLAVVTALAPPLAGWLAVYATRPLRPAARRVQDKAAELTERLEENLTGLREIVAFGQEALREAQFTKTMRELISLRMRLTFLDSGFQLGQSIFSFVVFLAILGYGGYLILQGLTTIGTLIAMQSLFNQTFTAAKQLFGLFKDVQVSMASVDRLYAFLDESPAVEDAPMARCLEGVRGEVVFESVSFGYGPDQLVLRDVDLHARPGELVALVGPSGAGKTTMTSLISRFYDPVDGRILLDGIDLRDVSLASLRSQIGVVFQDTFLFATSVRENIAIGRLGATDAEIIAAARAANAWEFIERLPHGLDSHVGQRGAQLSEGQKQRLAIARALLRDPRILILDEPTSALDARSENLLQGALQNLVHGRTTFVIAHRLATVQRADRIVVLDDGRVVEQGTHHQLIQHNGLYRELFELQFGPADSSNQRTPFNSGMLATTGRG